MPGLSRKQLFTVVSEAALVALLLAAAMFLYRPGLYVAGAPMDEAILLVYPELMLHGKMPYRDFETFYGPANLCTLAAVFRVCGTTVAVERIVGLVYRLVLFAILYLAARRWGKIASAGVVSIALFTLLPLWLFANAWIMALALATGSLSLLAWALASPERGRVGPVVAGCMGGTAILFRIDIAPAVITSGAILVFLLKRKEWWSYGTGIVAGCAPLLFWAFGAGHRQIIGNLFLYPVIYSHSARTLPLFGEGSQIPLFLCTVVGAAALILICGALAVWKKRAESGSAVLLAFGCLGIFTVPQALQRADQFHAAMSAPITVGLLPVLFAALVQLTDKRAFSPLFAGLMTAACLSVLFSICPQSAQVFDLIVRGQLAVSEIPENVARAGERKFPLSSPKDAQHVTRICAAITQRSQPGQRLFVGPRDLRRTNYNNVFFYYLLPQLEPASYFIEMNPLSANRVDSRLANDIDTADWVILDSQLSAFHEPNASEQLGPDAPMIVIRDHFVQVAQLDQFSIFRRRANRDVGSSRY